MKTNEGMRSQIKKATSIKAVKKLLRTAEEANNRHGYVYACRGYMDKLRGLSRRIITELEGRKSK